MWPVSMQLTCNAQTIRFQRTVPSQVKSTVVSRHSVNRNRGVWSRKYGRLPVCGGMLHEEVLAVTNRSVKGAEGLKWEIRLVASFR